MGQIFKESINLSSNSLSTDSKRRVAIVGGGLVGALAALYFAQRDWNVDLFELRKDLRLPENKDSVPQKSINLALSARGISALSKAGLGLDEVTAIPMKGRMIHVGEDKLKSQPYGNPHENIYSVEREFLLELLLNAAESFRNVKFFFQHRLKRCNFDAGSLEFENTKNGKMVQYTADLIVGADGVYSTVRNQLMRTVNMDYQQEYIPHAYCELTIPPKINEDGEREFAMEHNHLHIWPRHTFMMIALPNKNKTFTCTLFMPNEMFDAIKTEDDLNEFFQKHFPDSIPLIGEQRLKEEYFTNPKGSLMSIKCKPYHYKNRVIIIGDAAHCMVPFYGQGMNCGFQDVELLHSILEKFNIKADRGDDNLISAFETFTNYRHPDAVAICDLAMNNYHEMRSSVLNPLYLIRKKIEGWLHWIFPKRFQTLYAMISFSTMRYSEAVVRERRQRLWLKACLLTVGFGIPIFLGYRYMRPRRSVLAYSLFNKKFEVYVN